MGVGIGGILQQLILPPGGFIFLSLCGLMLMRRHQRTGLYMAVSGLILVLLASLPVTATMLLSALEPETALIETLPGSSEIPPQAIVILGAGRHYDTPEFGSDTPNAKALERIRYGVWLARRTLLPVLVTGGLGDDKHLSEAQMMKQIIEDEFALPVHWVEEQSRTTYENAKYSAEILKAQGIESIYLVTHALHMKRSVMSFEKFGFFVHPAPTAFESHSKRPLRWQAFLPSAKALNRTTQVFHEWVGLLWYRLRY